MSWKRILPLVLIAGILGPVAARADWIALKSGQRIETKGRWAVAGRYVAYYDLNGETHVIAVMTIDYDQTREVNFAAMQGKPLPPPPPPGPRHVIDDSMVRRLTPAELGRLDDARRKEEDAAERAKMAKRQEQAATTAKQQEAAEKVGGMLANMFDGLLGYIHCQEQYPSNATAQEICKMRVDQRTGN